MLRHSRLKYRLEPYEKKSKSTSKIQITLSKNSLRRIAMIPSAQISTDTSVRPGTPIPPLSTTPELFVASKPTIYDNFKKNDLMFGLSRNEYRYKTLKVLMQREYDYYLANSLNHNTVAYVVSNTKPRDKALTPYEQKHYTFLMSIRDYIIRPGGKPIASVMDDLAVSIGVRRACKSLIRYASATQRIHYELDGLDIEKTCEKKPGDISICNSEIRAAYREYKNKGVNNPHLFFYSQGVVCPPPWHQIRYKKHWEKYDALRAEKKEKITLKKS